MQNPLSNLTVAPVDLLATGLYTTEQFYADLLRPHQQYVEVTTSPAHWDDASAMGVDLAACPKQISRSILKLSKSGTHPYVHQDVRGSADTPDGAACMWIDLLVGKPRFGDTRRHPTTRAAIEALSGFCGTYGLSLPTHLVNSGDAIRATWMLDELVSRTEWTCYHGDLVALAVHFFLHVFDGPLGIRTSFLPPGTRNHLEGCDVELLWAEPTKLSWEMLKDQLRNAMRSALRSGRLC